MAFGAERPAKAMLSAPRSGCPHLTENTCFSSPSAGAARRFVSGLLFCATNPAGLSKCTETPILRFSVMLIGYMRVSSSDERQVLDLQLDALLAAGVDERHLHQDKQSGGRDDRVGLKTCLAGLRADDVLVVWKLDRLGRSLSHLVRILDDLKGRGVAFRSLTEGVDTTTSHGEFLYNLFGTLAQYERSLIRERVNAGLAAARRRGRRGGRPPAIDPETVDQIVAALDGGSSKPGVCRTFKIARSTLNDTLERIGWSGAAQQGPEKPKPDAPKPREQERGVPPAVCETPDCMLRGPCRG